MHYKINFDALRQEGLKSLFEALERSFNHLNIDFYLVGATARDTWFAQKGIKTLGTKDVDFAVYISSKDDYEKLREWLHDKEGFAVSSQNQFVLFSSEGIQVDLLPFGAIELEGKLMIEGEGLAKIAVNGFREVYERGTDMVQFENEQTFKVCTLPGIVILKLIAFDDRPELRQKDMQDITLILKHYFDLQSDIIYESHNDIFEEDIDLTLIAARVIGRQMKLILNRSSDLKNRIIDMLEKEIRDSGNSRMAELMVTGTENTIESALDLIDEIIKGIQE